jgi:hypothetical protein
MKKPTIKQKEVSISGNTFEEFDYFGMGAPEEIEEISLATAKEDLTFKFVASASKTKQDLVKNAEVPEEIERQYVPFLTNKSFSFHADTILHANEMNMKHWLFKDAQYRYYLGALRPRDRRSAWFKPAKDVALDNIQMYYQCNRSVAKQYAKVLTKENIELINTKVSKGGA